MNNKIIEDLVELDVYDSTELSKEEYNNLITNNKNKNIFYITGCYDYDNADCNKYYKEIDTKGLSIEDVKLKLEIDRTKNIRSIKSMVKFFVVLTIISMIIMFFGGMSLMDALEGIR